MTENAASPHDSAKKDCGCGCAGDCGHKKEVSEPSSQARRALMIGAGSAAFVATLANRRAFAAQCGPLSRIGSPQPSQQVQQSQCGGLTPGFWRNHADCVAKFIGGNPNTVTLGAKLPNLTIVEPACASMTFTAALCSSHDCFHWAGAILDALTPLMNPHYGYNIVSLNIAILTAFNQLIGQGMTPAEAAMTILNALETLENDFGTNDGGCKQGSLCG